MNVSRDRIAAEVRTHEELFDKFLDRLPKEFVFERETFKTDCSEARKSGPSVRCPSADWSKIC
jgi:hypothetical protein